MFHDTPVTSFNIQYIDELDREKKKLYIEDNIVICKIEKYAFGTKKA